MLIEMYNARECRLYGDVGLTTDTVSQLKAEYTTHLWYIGFGRRNYRLLKVAAGQNSKG
jgi:hypothetical protein